MMTEVVQEIKHSDKPVIRNIQDHKGAKVFAIGLGRGVELAEHIAPCKAKLLVVKGEIDFITKTESRRFACYESFEIPINVKHSVVAWNDAVFLLFLTE